MDGWRCCAALGSNPYLFLFHLACGDVNILSKARYELL